LDSLISPTLVCDASGAVALISLGLTISARVRSDELADGLLHPLSSPIMILSGSGSPSKAPTSGRNGPPNYYHSLI
jgi:hypothetical protein